MGSKRVRMSAGALRTQLLFDEARCFLATAKTVDQTLVGHAFAVRFPYPPLGGGEVIWVTQLVVDAAFRSRGVATGLCRALLKLPDPFDQPFFACGIASSHPHAVRALERATGRPRCPETAREHGAGLRDCRKRRGPRRPHGIPEARRRARVPRHHQNQYRIASSLQVRFKPNKKLVWIEKTADIPRNKV